jgi:hypothetical protein
VHAVAQSSMNVLAARSDSTCLSTLPVALRGSAEVRTSQWAGTLWLVDGGAGGVYHRMHRAVLRPRLAEERLHGLGVGHGDLVDRRLPPVRLDRGGRLLGSRLVAAVRQREVAAVEGEPLADGAADAAAAADHDRRAGWEILCLSHGVSGPDPRVVPERATPGTRARVQCARALNGLVRYL